MSLGGIVACVRCRTPFHLAERGHGGAPPGTITNQCRKCNANTQKYGPPAACEHCGLQAAYTGTKCRRCFAAIVKWGPPVPCCRCARVCAFQRPDLSTGQTAASPLCFVCSLAKHRQTLITARPPGNKLRAGPGTDPPPHQIALHPHLDNHINITKLQAPPPRIIENYAIPSPKLKHQQVNDSPDSGSVSSDDSDVPMDF